MGGTTAQYRQFPTKHPYVQNKEGSESNVLLGTFGIDDKQYVIPTMVEGKKLSPNQAVDTAMQYGIEKYPSFNTVEQADTWAKKYHGRVQPDGTIK
jgi:hypothetical protein